MRLHYIIPESLKNVICLIFCNYKKLQPSLSLSVLTAIFLGEPGLASFIEAKDDGSGGANCSSKTCKDPAKLSPPANQHPTFLQARCPSCRPTNSDKILKGNFYGCEVKDGNTIVLHIQGDSNCQPPTGWHKIIISLGVGSTWASTNYPLKSLRIYVIIGGSTTTTTDELKILGLVLDSSLTFGKHVQNTVKKLQFPPTCTPSHSVVANPGHCKHNGILCYRFQNRLLQLTVNWNQ